ncbi:MAG: hypothetical protein AAGA30_04740, partial [Planctomycetota bacterium]
DAKIKFDVNSGTFTSLTANLNDQWQRIVLVSTGSEDNFNLAGEPIAPNLFIYNVAEGTLPQDLDLFLTNLMVYQRPVGTPETDLQDIVCRAAFNHNQYGVQVVGDANHTFTPNKKSTVLYNSPLTAERDVVLPAFGFTGEQYKVIRHPSSGGSNLNIKDSQGNLIRRLSAPGEATLIFDGQWR